MTMSTIKLVAQTINWQIFSSSYAVNFTWTENFVVSYILYALFVILEGSCRLGTNKLFGLFHGMSTLH